jgi:hypothetical protein
MRIDQTHSEDALIGSKHSDSLSGSAALKTRFEFVAENPEMSGPNALIAPLFEADNGIIHRQTPVLALSKTPGGIGSLLGLFLNIRTNTCFSGKTSYIFKV